MSKYTEQMQLNMDSNFLLCRNILTHSGNKQEECMGSYWFIAEDGSVYCARCKEKTSIQTLATINLKRRLKND